MFVGAILVLLYLYRRQVSNYKLKDGTIIKRSDMEKIMGKIYNSKGDGSGSVPLYIINDKSYLEGKMFERGYIKGVAKKLKNAGIKRTRENIIIATVISKINENSINNLITYNTNIGMEDSDKVVDEIILGAINGVNDVNDMNDKTFHNRKNLIRKAMFPKP